MNQPFLDQVDRLGDMTRIKNLYFRFHIILLHAFRSLFRPIRRIEENPVREIHGTQIKRTHVRFQKDRTEPAFSNVRTLKKGSASS